MSVSKVTICYIQLSQHERLRINGKPFPTAVVDPIRSIITERWGEVQKENSQNGAHEFKLKGYPWGGTRDEAVKSRSLLAGILKKMSELGWNLLQSCDTSKKTNDKDTLFFQYTQPDPECQMFAVSFNRSDRIRLIDSPGPSIEKLFKEAVSKSWEEMGGVDKMRDYFGALEIKLKGNPWLTHDGGQSTAAKLLMCYLLSEFAGVGYTLYASVDISAKGTEHVGDLESWFFKKGTVFLQ